MYQGLHKSIKKKDIFFLYNFKIDLPVYILLRQTEYFHSYLEVHLTIHTCICIALPDFSTMQVFCSCLLKGETLSHSCASHKHQHKSEGKETKNFRSDPSECWFFYAFHCSVLRRSARASRFIVLHKRL